MSRKTLCQKFKTWLSLLIWELTEPNPLDRWTKEGD